MNQFREAIRAYFICENRQITIVKNDNRIVRAKCVGKCKWEVYANLQAYVKTFQLMKFFEKQIYGWEYNPYGLNLWEIYKHI